VIVAVVFAFAIKGHDEAVLCCAGIGGVLALSALIWCAVELAWCHSYQGPVHERPGKTTVEDIEKKTDPYFKAKSYYEYRRFCHGRCYDWAYERARLTLEMDCKRESEKWFMDNFFTESQITITKFKTSGYAGVDSYKSSPIYESHSDVVDSNKYEYHPKSGVPGSASEYKADLDKFCAKFDDSKFIEKRDKCDKKIEEKFEPKCYKEYGKWMFAKGEKAVDIKKKDACMSNKNPIYGDTKWLKLMSGSPSFKKNAQESDKLSAKNRPNDDGYDKGSDDGPSSPFNPSGPFNPSDPDMPDPFNPSGPDMPDPFNPSGPDRPVPFIPFRR